jgi:Ca-activated chloride channel family protein
VVVHVTIRNILDSTGGNYFKSLDKEVLNQILLDLSSNIEYEEELSTIRDGFIGAAIIFLLLDFYIIYRIYGIAA